MNSGNPMAEPKVRELIILGTGGGAHDVLDVVDAINSIAPTWRIAGFLDDAREPGTSHLGLEVLGRVCDAHLFPGRVFANVIGSDKSYQRRPDILASAGLTPDRFATLVHPNAAVSPRARMGRGVHINFGVSIGGGVEIGDHVTVGPGCIVGHDTRIDDYSMLAPGAVVSGYVHIGLAAYIGAAASIRGRIAIGDGALVGMGAVVVRDVEAGVTVVGNPAAPLRRSR